jgi:hypothetical protein
MEAYACEEPVHPFQLRPCQVPLVEGCAAGHVGDRTRHRTGVI